MGKVLFSQVCFCLQEGEGVPQITGPWSFPGGGGTPGLWSQVLSWGSGVLLSWSWTRGRGGGTPVRSYAQGTPLPLARTRMGYPPLPWPGLGQGYTPPLHPSPWTSMGYFTPPRPPPPGRTHHGLDTARAVCLLRFHVGRFFFLFYDFRKYGPEMVLRV